MKPLIIGRQTKKEVFIINVVFYHRISRTTWIFDFSQAKNLSFYKPFPRRLNSVLMGIHEREIYYRNVGADTNREEKNNKILNLQKKFN